MRWSDSNSNKQEFVRSNRFYANTRAPSCRTPFFTPACSSRRRHSVGRGSLRMTRRGAVPDVSSGEALKLTRKQRREGVTARSEVNSSGTSLTELLSTGGVVEGARAAVSGQAASPAAPLDVSTARSAHRAARRAVRRSASSFDLHTVSDACVSLVLNSSEESSRVSATTRRQRCSVRAVAALYGLCCEEERPADATTLVLTRSPFWPATLPQGDAETMLARVLARGGAAFDLAHLQALARRALSSVSPQQRPAKAKRKKSEAGDCHAALITHVQPPPSLALALPLPLPRLAWAIDRT